MSRAKWKGPFITKNLLKIKKNKIKKTKKIYSRASIIPFFLIGRTVLVYNGKNFKPVPITREKIGFKFGEFAFTKRFTNKFLEEEQSKKN